MGPPRTQRARFQIHERRATGWRPGSAADQRSRRVQVRQHERRRRDVCRAHHGRIVTLTRQAIINDDLRAFERLVTAFGFAARRLENRTVYSQLTANAALADGTALFHANHSNLITSSALAIATLGAGRTAMRLQKGLQSEEPNLAPAFLIVPATLEQTAYNLTSANYVPSTRPRSTSSAPVAAPPSRRWSSPVLDANSTSAWYLAASSAQVDTVEYCSRRRRGPVIESEVGFETDGVFKCRLDFAASG